jgi:tetratricopeptide (TPR) repeat protein
LQRLPISLGEAARAASLEGHYLAALAFLAEAVGILEADPKSEPVLLAEAYWWRAMVLHRAGNDAAAQVDIERALRACARIKNPHLRAQDVAGIQVTAGAILRATDPAASVRHLTGALERHRRLSYRYLLVDAYLERGRAHRALGDRLAAQADFVAAIEEYERSRRSLDGPRVRATYFDQARDLFDETIALAIELDPTGTSALAIAERGRAQGLLDALTPRTEKARSDDEPIAAARAALPAGTALIVYSVLPRESVVWVLTSRQSSVVRLSAGATELDRLVGDLRRALIEGRPPSDEDEVLFDLLLRPLAGSLGGARSLVVVPDRALHGLPFAVLRDTTKGQTLAESRSLSVAPSVRTYLHALRFHAPSKQAAVLKVLSVADPAIDRRSYPNLAALRRAAGEGARTVERFPGSLLLTGTSATPGRFLAELNEHDVVLGPRRG